MRNLLRGIIFLAMVIFFPNLSFAATPLHDAAPGTFINFSGKQWVILDQYADGTTYVILNYNDGNRVFDPDNTQLFNPVDSNNIGYYLNNTFYNSLSQKDLIENHSWDIKFQDGKGSQANVSSKIALISYSEYQKYSSYYNGNILPASYSYYWWTRTPYSGNSAHVCYVSSNGSLGYYNANVSRGVRPALYLKSGLLLSEDNDVIAGGGEEFKPTGLIETSKSHDFIQLAWNGLENATEYIVFRGGSEIGRSNITQYSDLDVNPNMTYSYTIKAVVDGKESGLSDPLGVSTLPSPVNNLTAIATEYNKVQLSWDSSTDDGLGGYIIYRDDIEITRVGAAQSFYMDSGLIPSTIYSYKVKAYGTNGGTSLISPTKTVVTPVYKTEISYQFNQSNLIISWTGQADRYLVKVNGEKVAETTSNSYSFAADTGMTYQVQITAIFALDPFSQETKQFNSDIVKITTIPSAIDNLSATAIHKNVILSWDTSNEANLEGYIIYRDGSEIDRVGKFDTTYADNNVTPSTAYTYYIKSYDNENNTSEKSNEIRIKTLLSPPAGIKAGAKSYSEALITWELLDENDLQGFIVYRDDVEIGRTSKDTVSFTDVKLEPETEYSYTVQAFDIENIKSEFSNPVTVETLAIPKPKLVAKVNGTSINLSWEGYTGSYSVFVNGLEVAQTNSTSYQYSGNLNESYQFEIVSVYGKHRVKSNSITVRLTPMTLPKGAVTDVVKNVGEVAAPVGGLLALGLAIKASPFLITIVKGLLFRL